MFKLASETGQNELGTGSENHIGVQTAFSHILFAVEDADQDAETEEGAEDRKHIVFTTDFEHYTT